MKIVSLEDPVSTPPDALIGTVVRVGDGRGFIIEVPEDVLVHGNTRLIVTTAHCLPHLPPAHPWMYTEEKTYDGLIAALGDEPTLWAECLFADPVSDIAVLTGPDNQTLTDQAHAFEEFIESIPKVFQVRAPSTGKMRGWLLTLDSVWNPCVVEQRYHTLWVTESAQPIEAGMSGSPILDENANAIGVVSTSSETESGTEDGLEPCLSEVLPAWLTRSLGI